MKNMVQNYDAYQAEDFEVWNILFSRQIEQLQSLGSIEFLQGIEEIGFRADIIPDFRQVNIRLKETCGWKIQVVPGIVPEKEFYQMLANKIFPSSTWLRTKKDLDYLSEPDMFHDTFGHMPLLTNAYFSEFFRKLGALGVKYQHDDSVLTKLTRLYWFTVEFGLIRNNDQLKIYGAGILSSFGESKFSVSDTPIHIDFDMVKIFETPFDNTVIQELYFVIHSMAQLEESIFQFERQLITTV